tara:strand:+ start:1218 stop:1439 length:222 start_codon:yes stop_codon:yes gene_type:complete
MSRDSGIRKAPVVPLPPECLEHFNAIVMSNPLMPVKWAVRRAIKCHDLMLFERQMINGLRDKDITVGRTDGPV